MTALLDLRGVSVAFGGMYALRDVDLRIVEDSITALVGPNGAGKSTALNAITGIAPLHAGHIEFRGADLGAHTIHGRARLGIGRTFQNLRLFGELSVRDNVVVALAATRCPTPWHLVRRANRRAALRNQADEVLDEVGLADFGDRRVDDLPYGVRKQVEIARALSAGKDLLLLDEPGAGLAPTEKDALADMLRRVRRGGTTILLIDHDMTFVMALADVVAVLHHGQLLATGLPEEVQVNADVIDAYLGVPT